MPIYPGEPKPEFQPYFVIGRDKVNVTKLILSSHTGTHVDAPKHFIANANGIDKFPLDIFKARILDLSRIGVGHAVTSSDLDVYSDLMEDEDILLIYTGTSDNFRSGIKFNDNNNSILTDFSYLDPSAAQWIVDHDIKCVGIDSFSMEKYNFKKGLTHVKLLSNGIGIIEGINSELKKFLGRRMFLVCLPLPFEGIDGSPARVLLFEFA